jgi:uracil phosphoribosyltransferase
MRMWTPEGLRPGEHGTGRGTLEHVDGRACTPAPVPAAAWGCGRDASRQPLAPASAPSAPRRAYAAAPGSGAAMSERIVHHITHPLIQHKLTLMRQKDRSTNSFRRLLNEISMLMAYEVTRDMPTQLIEIETPLETMQAPVIDGKKTVFVSIMRAGAGFLDGMLNVVPGARIGHVGLYRDPKTLVAVEYYFKMPAAMHERDAIVLDPMLATGNSAVAAVDRLKETRPKSIRFVCLLAAPEGLANFHANHPDVPVYVAAIDRRLDENGYIVPGLGDAGDRLFGTK